MQLRVKELDGNGQKPVQVSDSHLFYGLKPKAASSTGTITVRRSRGSVRRPW